MLEIEKNFIGLHPKSKSLFDIGQTLFPSGVTHDIRAFRPFPIYVERADKGKKWDVDGNELVDYIGGHGSLLLGHNRQEITKAVQDALNFGTHFGSSHNHELDWAQSVIDMVPCAENVRFTSSGTEATMMALRLARAFTNREVVIKLEDHFHGWHDIVVGKNHSDSINAPGVPIDFYKSLSILPQNDIDSLVNRLKHKDVAAVILEPTGSHWGAHPLDIEYLKKVDEATKATGTLFIMDEVITGFRMSPGGAQELYDLKPDLSTHAKILAGGLPGGCVAGRKDILNRIEFRDDQDWNSGEKIAHQGTYNANPISATAGKVALGLIKDGEEIRKADELSVYLIRSLNEMFNKHNINGRAWTVSSMWHLNLGFKNLKQFSDIEETDWIYDESPNGVRDDLVLPMKWSLLNHGVDLFGTGGVMSSAHTIEDIHLTTKAFEVAMQEMRSAGLEI
jgi:glutamate-1-semialdehyde 2,1-aminomutase